jgi:hypothetical protein
MKKLLFLIVGLMLVTGIASANAVFVFCTVPGATFLAGTGAAQLENCPGWGMGATTGWVLNDAKLYYLTDVDLVTSGAPVINMAGSPQTGTWVPNPQPCTISGQQAQNNTCGFYSGTMTAPGTSSSIDTTSADLAGLFASGFQISWTSNNSGGGVVNNSAGVGIVEYDYSAINSTPEPMTMMLVGGGLLGVGLLASKRRKKA